MPLNPGSIPDMRNSSPANFEIAFRLGRCWLVWFGCVCVCVGLWNKRSLLLGLAHYRTTSSEQTVNQDNGGEWVVGGAKKKHKTDDVAAAAQAVTIIKQQQEFHRTKQIEMALASPTGLWQRGGCWQQHTGCH